MKEDQSKLNYSTKWHYFSTSIEAFILNKSTREAQEVLCINEKENEIDMEGHYQWIVLVNCIM